MPTTFEKERQLQDEIATRVEHDLPGVDVLAVELLAPTRFCVYVDHPRGCRPRALRARHRRAARLPARVLASTSPRPGSSGRCAGASTSSGAVGRRVRVRTTDRKLRGRGRLRGEQTVTVAAADGAETDIPYAAIVRANLIDEGA